jgi:hypothetical protein
MAVAEDLEASRRELFAGKYKDGEKIWSGKSFLQYHNYRELLAELPISGVAVPTREYRLKLQGNGDYVYGELVFSLQGFEGYLRDKAFHLDECSIRPIIRANTFILAFDLDYTTKAGEKETRPCEVLRLDETRYLLFLDYYRPL